jgi:hypothetical protein
MATDQGSIDDNSTMATGSQLGKYVAAHKSASARAYAPVADGDSPYGKVLGAPGLDNDLSLDTSYGNAATQFGDTGFAATKGIE